MLLPILPLLDVEFQQSLVGKMIGFKIQGSVSSQTAGPQEELPGEPVMSGGTKYNYSL